MPWLAEQAGSWAHWVEPGSSLEAVYTGLGYVEVPAPDAAGAPVAEPDAERDDTGEHDQTEHHDGDDLDGIA